MPRAKQNPAPANFQLAPLCCACHGSSLVCATPKARTEPGPVDIAMRGANVSGLVCVETGAYPCAGRGTKRSCVGAVVESSERTRDFILPVVSGVPQSLRIFCNA